MNRYIFLSALLFCSSGFAQIQMSAGDSIILSGQSVTCSAASAPAAPALKPCTAARPWRPANDCKPESFRTSVEYTSVMPGPYYGQKNVLTYCNGTREAVEYCVTSAVEVAQEKGKCAGLEWTPSRDDECNPGRGRRF